MKNFIPKPYKKEPVTIRIDIEKLEKIDKILGVYKINRSKFINRCIDYAMENMYFENNDQFSSSYNRI